MHLHLKLKHIGTKIMGKFIQLKQPFPMTQKTLDGELIPPKTTLS